MQLIIEPNWDFLDAMHQEEFPVVDASIEEVQKLYHLAKAVSPQGLYGDDRLTINIEDEDWGICFFTNRGKGQDVEFRIFHPDQYYASNTFIAYESGKLEQNAENKFEGVPAIPSLDLIRFEVTKALLEHMKG